MNTTASVLSIIVASALTSLNANAAPVAVPADNEVGWKEQAEHSDEHKTRADVVREMTQWRAAHEEDGAKCRGGQVYCGHNQHRQMMKGGAMERPLNESTPSDVYLGP